MKRISLWRPATIAAITLISFILFFPTVRYLIALREPLPADPAQKEAREKELDELRKKAIPLGLDLRGGVDVTLMLDEKKAMADAVNNMVATLKNDFADKKISASVRPLEMEFAVKALDKADARNIFNTLQNYAPRLTGDYSQAKLEEMQEVKIGMKKEALEDKLRQDISGAEKIIRTRLDKFGVTQPSIAIQGRDRIRVQVAGEKDPDKLIENLSKLTVLEVRLTHELYGTPNDPIKDLLDEKGELKPDAVVPLGYEVVPYQYGRVDKTTHEMKYEKGKLLVEREIRLKGDNLRGTGVQQDPFDLENPIKVSLQFDDKGGKIFADLTKESVEKAKQDGHPRNLAILIDGVVITAPRLGVIITGGNAVIEGGFQREDATDLSLLLKAGSLPAPLVPESKHAVGATLGTESIFAGVRALFWATLAVVAFMVIYYGMAGCIAVVALVLNVLVVLAALALSNSTLTLSGIGGIMLTIGMAVDANVLIYERIREELEDGKTLKQAISLGYDRAFSVIFDAHVTTLVTALALLQFTEGSVFGFALTMTFGLISNLYTGLTVTYTLCALWFQWRGNLGLGKLRMFAHTAFDFIKMRYVTIGGSWLFIGVGAIALYLHGGLNFGVDFAGGVLTEIHFVKPTTEEEIRGHLHQAGLEGERVQSVPGTSDFIIRVKAMKSKEAGAGRGDSNATEAAVRQALVPYSAEGFQIKNMTTFGAETGQEFKKMAISVVALSALAIIAYLWIRFELVFGVAAVIALVHDLFITAILASFWHVEITLDTVAALMVLLGFSVNDTIVIFDRIRENTRKMPGKNFGELCNLAMNQSLARTIITSGTVFLVVVVMLFIGGEGLKPFAKVMTIGAIVGTYSSDFIAAPAVYIWNLYRKNRVVAQLTAKKHTGPEPARVPGAEATPGAGRLPRSRAV